MQTVGVSDRKRLVAAALAVGLIAFISAIAASWPWDSRPGDPRWEMIHQRARDAKREVERRRRNGFVISKELLDAEIEMESELATQDDLDAAGRALHTLEEKLTAPVDPSSSRTSSR